MDTGILLESGTNELEILEFNIGSNHYGINVAKVKEIMSYQPPTPVPNAHPSIEGIFMPRDTIISIVDLAKSLSIPPSTDPKRDMYIITNFNKLNIGFHVQGNYNTAVSESFALMGMTLMAEYLDGIAIVDIGTATFTAVQNPVKADIGTYFEKNANNDYFPTSDTDVVSGKTYYTRSVSTGA